MTFYVVIDTNVLVSALLSSNSNASTVQVVAKLFTKDVIPLLSKEIVDEYNEVLRREKFNFSEELVANLIDIIKNTGEMIVPSPSDEILIDMKDLLFYEAVLSKKAYAYLITGNMKHFPRKPYIVTPNEFLEIFNNGNNNLD